jgi:hypothetical protein
VELDDLLAHAGRRCPELFERLRGDTFALARETEKDVLCR